VATPERGFWLGATETMRGPDKTPARGTAPSTAMLEAARGLPDLLKARREALEARWRGEMVARHA
jgi:hypothetical protein